MEINVFLFPIQCGVLLVRRSQQNVIVLIVKINQTEKKIHVLFHNHRFLYLFFLFNINFVDLDIYNFFIYICLQFSISYYFTLR